MLVGNASTDNRNRMAAFEEAIGVSIECVDNADGFSGVVVYDDETFPVSSIQDVIEWTVSDNGQGPYSSVRPFQSAYYESEDAAMHRPDQPETNSLASPQEEEEEEDGGKDN